jgi:hypothetical protein
MRVGEAGEDRPTSSSSSDSAVDTAAVADGGVLPGFGPVHISLPETRLVSSETRLVSSETRLVSSETHLTTPTTATTHAAPGTGAEGGLLVGQDDATSISSYDDGRSGSFPAVTGSPPPPLLPSSAQQHSQPSYSYLKALATNRTNSSSSSTLPSLREATVSSSSRSSSSSKRRPVPRWKLGPRAMPG